MFCSSQAVSFKLFFLWMSTVSMLSILVALQWFCFSVVSVEVLRIGGLVQDTGVGSSGKAAWESWRDWVNENRAAA